MWIRLLQWSQLWTGFPPINVGRYSLRVYFRIAPTASPRFEFGIYGGDDY